jgi:phosphopantetheine--protein transferase-like protein
MVGIDIVDISRFKKICANDYRHWENVYTKAEWKYVFGSVKKAERLAGIFAAKEAVMKAVGGDLVGRFDLIEISHDLNGMPIATILRDHEQVVFVSIGHDGGVAAAIAFKKDD